MKRAFFEIMVWLSIAGFFACILGAIMLAFKGDVVVSIWMLAAATVIHKLKEIISGGLD